MFKYMKIISLRDTNKNERVSIEDTIRNSFYIQLKNVKVTGRSIHYPNCLLELDGQLLNPYDERVMSLQRDSFYEDNIWDLYSPTIVTKKELTPVFFFIYNVDNYYHFVYDTLSILYSYFRIKECNPTLKLLLNTSHPTKAEFPQFVTEFLGQFGIRDYLVASSCTEYETVFVSTSFTHGRHSNEPASMVAYSVWNQLTVNSQSTPRRFYVSRRSWIHGKTENIGTNYTTRRKCMNEDAVVELLKSYDIQEVFTELLTTEEKLAYFKQAELVVGVIGGGMCNLLFSPCSTKALCISTPQFLEINNRFRYSMDHTNIVYSNCTEHAVKGVKFQPYSRVKIINPKCTSYGRIGEVETLIGTDQYIVEVASQTMAGFSQDFPTSSIEFHESELEAMDAGLNSPYNCNIEQLEVDLKKLLSSE